MHSLLAPGQGSQKPGQLQDWLGNGDNYARRRIQHWSELTQLPLLTLGTTASAADITSTSVTQPLVVANALLAFELAQSRGALTSHFLTAGHSVGELAAAAIAGIITADQAVTLAALRGREMEKACQLVPTGMTAVLGGDETEVLEQLQSLHLVPANRNAKGQIVAAGKISDLEQLAAHPPAKARLRSLPVAGAFHTEFMQPAQDAITAAISKLQPAEPTQRLLSNSDGKPVRSGIEALEKIAAQVTRPVRWDLCTQTMIEQHVTTVAELPPAGTLVGIAKRTLPAARRLAIKTPADFIELAQLHADSK